MWGGEEGGEGTAWRYREGETSRTWARFALPFPPACWTHTSATLPPLLACSALPPYSPPPVIDPTPKRR